MRIISGPASKALAEAVSVQSDIPNVQIISKIFPDGEVYVRLDGDIKGEKVSIIQTTCPPMQDNNLLQLAFLADAAKRAGAIKVTAIVPYLAYARQDKMFLAGEGISVETIMRMLKSAGIDELLTVNIHSEHSLTQFPFPAKSISAIPLIADYFVKKGHKGAYALAPDKGAMYIAQQAQTVLSGKAGHLTKTRDRYTGQIIQTAEGLNVEGQTVIILDDIISTGGTIVGAAKILREQGASHVFCGCVHGLLIGDAKQRILEAGVEEIVSTDSVPGVTSKVLLTPLISQALKGAV
ncbi:MAG: ribose-phosphate diphosphokinase [Nitrososphaerota archaeon]|jgi:ribose-phosphate pyrophosphokinase|nr:ribose-phosphate diphosphokinase [Nitrososphaerota archaeon]